MISHEYLALGTCRDHLTAAHLKSICRYRGFPTPKAGKDALVDTVAPRLLGVVGVEEAARTLTPEWLWVAHYLAGNETPVSLEEIRRRVDPEKAWYHADYRAFFGRLADGLLNRGLILVHEGSTRSKVACERLEFLLCPAHAALLPACPIPVQSVPDASSQSSTRDFARLVLQERVRAVTKKGAKDPPPESLLGEVVQTLSLSRGIHHKGRLVADLDAFLACIRKVWLEREASTTPALTFAFRILSHLPPGKGVSSKDLQAAVSRWGGPLPAEGLQRFIADGLLAGFITAHTAGGAEPLLRAAPPPSPPAQAVIASRGTAQALEIDVGASDPDIVLAVSALGRVQRAGDLLSVEPDPAVLGVAEPPATTRTILNHALPALEAVRKTSSAWDRALSLVFARKDRLLVHEGLVVLRVEDMGFRFKVEHALGPLAVSLGGPWIAVPRDQAADVEKMARKNGFFPRFVEGAPVAEDQPE